MAIAHFKLTARIRSSGSAPGSHVVQYLVREGKYAPKDAEVAYLTRAGAGTQDRGDLRHVETGNLPAWAHGDAAVFFQAAYEHERVGGRYALAIQMALPRELSHAQQLELAQDFAAVHLYDKPYLLVKHEPAASDGQLQPHIHILLSARSVDGIARDECQTFRRFNREHPEQGGAEKDRWWNERRAIDRLRVSAAAVTNFHLERAGAAVRIDPRSLYAQDILREPAQKYRGPAQTARETREVREEQAKASAAWALHKTHLGITDVHTISRDDFVLLVREQARSGHPGQATPAPSLDERRTKVVTLDAQTQPLEQYTARVHGAVMVTEHQASQGKQPSDREQHRQAALVAQGSALGLEELDDTVTGPRGVRVAFGKEKERAHGLEY